MKLKSKINNRILYDFVWLDLLILKSYKKINFKRVNSYVNSINNYNSSLHLNETFKDFKQFVRIFQTLNSKNKKSLLIQISDDELIKFIKSNINDKEIILTNNFLRNKIHYKNSNRVLLLIEEPLEKYNSLLLQKISKDSIGILSKWNRKIEKNNFGSYKFYNDFKDFKKIGLLIAMIKHI